jgi:hypothetical protein
MVFGKGGGQGFCDDSTSCLIIFRERQGEGVAKMKKLRNVIYERPLTKYFYFLPRRSPAVCKTISL